MELFLKEKKKNNDGWSLIVLSIVALLLSILFFIYAKYPDLLDTDVFLVTSGEISPKSPIIIDFSRAVIPNRMDWYVDLKPNVKANYQWENKNKKLIITPQTYWQLENDYFFHIAGRNIFLMPFNEDIHFRTISYPKINEFYPATGSKDVILDIEDPISASFDSSINDFKVKFTISPFEDVSYNIDSEKNKIDLMTKVDLKKGQKYNIVAFIRYKDESENEYKKIGETAFNTKPIPPQTWEKDFNARLEQARNFTDPKITEGKYIDINLKSQILSIFENGKLLDAYMVSSGKRGMETPQGSFQVQNKTPRAWSKKYGLFMPYWMAIVRSGDFGIHELPEWPGGYKEGANHLGTPVSHGCVRLGVGPAKRVYEWADIGTPIVVHS